MDKLILGVGSKPTDMFFERYFKFSTIPTIPTVGPCTAQPIILTKKVQSATVDRDGGDGMGDGEANGS